MDRLTTKCKDGRYAIANHNNATPLEQTLKITDVINRLGAYEDTGLEPEEVNRLLVVSQNDKMMLDRIERIISELGSLNHLRDLLTAEQDGRCVVMPCKVGDTVWVSPNNGKSFHTGKLYGVNERGAYLVFVDDSERYSVRNPVGRAFYDWFAKVYTREAAEAALRGEQNG